MNPVTTILTQPVQSAKSIENQDSKKKKEAHWNSREVLMIGIGIATVTAACGILLLEVAFLVKEIVQDRIWQPDPKELEDNISKKYSLDFIDKIKRLCHQDLSYIRLFKRLAVCKEDETEIISYLEKNYEITPDQLKEILMGAHVRLDDNGKAYKEWVRKVASKQSRISSHPSDKTQYGIRGSLIKELLFSRTTGSDGKAYTWFQLENHPVSFGHIVRHMIDYVKYKITNKNQGPYGSSEATHHTPIILKQKFQATS